MRYTPLLLHLFNSIGAVGARRLTRSHQSGVELFALFKNAILDIIWGRRFFFSQFCAPFCCYIKWVWFEVIRLFIKCKAERIYFWSYRKKGFCVMFTMNCANIQYPVNRQIFNSNLWIGNILRILSFLEYSVNFEIKKSKINFAYLFLYIQFPREFVIWL